MGGGGGGVGEGGNSRRNPLVTGTECEQPATVTIISDRG